MTSSNVQEKLEEIDRVIARGLKTKAINKLQGLINYYPDELAYRNRLGQIYYDVAWLEKAGQYWLLVPIRDEKRAVAINAFKNSLNNSGYMILQTLKFKGNIELLPENLRVEIRKLSADSKTKMGVIPDYSVATSSRQPEKALESTNDLWFNIGCIVIILVFTMIGMAGLWTIGKWMFFRD